MFNLYSILSLILGFCFLVSIILCIINMGKYEYRSEKEELLTE